MSDLGIYFRVRREDHWDNVDIINLTEKELHEILENRAPIFLKKLVILLLKEIVTLKRWQEDAFEISSNIDLDIERIRKSRGEN